MKWSTATCKVAPPKFLESNTPEGLKKVTIKSL